MSLRSFFDLVEIKTKIASFFPFVIGCLFSLTYFGQFHWQYTLLFFVGMLIFDMTTTAIKPTQKRINTKKMLLAKMVFP